MNKLKALPALFLASAALADAGYLGSVTAGASPIGEHPSIAMTAEEVVIELRREHADYEDWSAEVYSATVTADFLFTNTGEADTVYMYIPHEIVTAFVPILFAAEEMEAPLENPRVLVDGEPVEVRKVCLGAFDPEFMGKMSWEEFAGLTRPLFAEMPGEGEPFYFTRYFADTGGLTHPADAVLAWWAVPFAPGRTRLVEYVQGYAPTSDYGEKAFRLTYPLFTGAAWSGAIGEGRVSVVPGEGCDWDDLAYHVGMRLPLPKEKEDYRLDVLGPIDDHPDFGMCGLARYDGERYHRTLVWEFSDYEPDPGRLNFNALYPDIGDIALFQQTLYEDFLAGAAEAYDNPWDYSMIYLCLGRYAPTYYKSVNTDGAPLFDSPGGSPLGESIPFLS
ncbi:MAG TPA: hypothetical protein ENN88_00005, partial [Candidatus Coatesbacteria bacterium]|nr:hypothetical protein [Candidatus Coatesbacteria bacterium]